MAASTCLSLCGVFYSEIKVMDIYVVTYSHISILKGAAKLMISKFSGSFVYMVNS